MGGRGREDRSLVCGEPQRRGGALESVLLRGVCAFEVKKYPSKNLNQRLESDSYWKDGMPAIVPL